MLACPRSAARRSILHQSRSLTSVQANAGSNGEVINQFRFAVTPQTSSSFLPTTPERKPITQAKQIEIPPAKDPLLEFFAGRMMEGGKRARAEKCTSEILLHINALTKAPALPVLRQAIELAAPAVRVLEHKMGGKVIVKPMALNERQRTRKAIDWILEASEARPGSTRGERIARECIRVIQGSSTLLEKKEKLHSRAMVSRGSLPRGS